MRNVIFTALNQSLHEASLLFEHFGRYGKTVKEVMDEADLLTFRRRWNLYKHKLDKEPSRAHGAHAAHSCMPASL